MQDKYILYRMMGSTVVFVILYSQMSGQGERMRKSVLKYPELKTMEQLGPRYFTIWNVIMQMFYILLSLVCDVTTLLNKENVISDSIRKFRYNLFSGLVFPISSAVLTFWAYFFYDRELIFPKIIDDVVPLSQNLMAHAGVFLYALWELIFLPRNSIENGPVPKKYLIIFGTTYLFVLFYTRYVDLGIWCYKIMTYLEGSYMFYFPLVFPIACATAGYCGQWKIRDAVWRYRKLDLKA